MSHKNQIIVNSLNMASDAVIVFVSYWLSLFIRYFLLDGKININLTDTLLMIMIVIYSLLIVSVLYVFKMYGTYRFKSYIKESACICTINACGMIVLMAIFFITRTIDFSRVALFIWWGISCGLLIIKRFVFRTVFKRLYGSNMRKNLAVIGNGELAAQFVGSIGDIHAEINYKGYVSGTEKSELGTCLGRYEDLEHIIEEHDIDELVVALESHETKFMPYVFYVADKEGIGLRLIPFYNKYFPKNATMESVGNTKLINVRVTPLDNLAWYFIKRLIDICGSLFGLIVLSPIYIITAVGVKLSSPGPIFFKQDRIGLHKKPFKMYKFRSMRVNDKETTGWSTNIDPRKTPFGSFIRKYSIDELPQLFNVLKGDMSLIGPRPEVPFYVWQFKEEIPLYLLRHQVRPGMTGWAQVHGLRGDTSIEDRVEYDIWYIENWSLWLDIKILWKTVFGGLKNSEELVKKEKETV